VYVSIGDIRKEISNENMQDNTYKFDRNNYRSKRISVNYPYAVFVSLYTDM